MATGNMGYLSKRKAFIVEFIAKPAIFTAAIWAHAISAWLCPVKSEEFIQIIHNAQKAARLQWDGNQFLEWKMGVYAVPVASFFEADNAYARWWARFIYFEAEKYGYLLKFGAVEQERQAQEFRELKKENAKLKKMLEGKHDKTDRKTKRQTAKKRDGKIYDEKGNAVSDFQPDGF